ncbi:hypothetical protein KQX54_015627 [Cotesia glomerata]|uniref:Uncharacterized protein n=1 Tax=Cotesia glomerata TaxID=32391 RepID=A0AAV7IWU2_COTGL|nr:hypothetical protein KQX54_015627 [Cotesia glomerata]
MRRFGGLEGDNCSPSLFPFILHLTELFKTTDISVGEFLKNTPYAIVVFDEHDDFDNKLIDLVPTSWIIINEDDEECLYQYPPIEIARTQLTKWLKELKKPDKNWTSHQVEVKLRAHDYKQGLRRLQRAFTTAQAASESEDSYKPTL